MRSYPLAAAGIQTRVIEAGVSGLPVVFLHGVGARADRWRANLSAFALAGYHAFALDLPGHGYAEKHGKLDFEPPALVDFLEGTIEQLGIPSSAVWVGTSYGAVLAAALARLRPQRVAALVLVGCLGLAPLGESALQRMSDALTARTRADTRAKLERLVFDPALVTNDWVLEEFRFNNSHGAGEALAALANFVEHGRLLRQQSVLRWLQAMGNSVPLALAWGVQDRSVPVDVGRMACRALPWAQWIEISDACHAPYLERPDLFNERVLAFLEKVDIHLSERAAP